MFVLKIIILTKKYGYNFTGATTTTHRLVQEWASKNNISNIYIFAKYVGNNVQNKKVTVYNFNNFNDIKIPMKRIYENSKDIVCYSDDHLGYYFSKLGYPYVHTYHGNWPDARYTSLDFFFKSFYFIDKYKKTIKNARLVVNVSEYMRKFTRRFNKNDVIIRNGVQVDLNHAKNKLILPHNNKIIMVGSVDKRKYSKLLNLLDKGSLKDYTIDIYGGILNKTIERKLSSFKNVNLKGFSDTINMSDYSLFLCTSKSENMPISICEALCSGLPVVAFRVGGIPEIVENTNGSVIDKFDIEDMLKEIQKYFRNEKKFSYDFDRYNEFDWENVAVKYMNKFEEVLNL